MSDGAIRSDPLPVGSIDRRTSGWYGMLAVLMTEGALFAYLLFSYYYFAVQYGREWLPPQLPGFRFSLPNTVLILASSAAVWAGQRGIQLGNRGRLALGLAVAIALGLVFCALQAWEWVDEPFTIAFGSYASVYYTISAFHLAHAAVGLLILLALLVWTLLGYFDASRNAAVAIGAIYWFFVAAVWLAVFFTIYITPYLG